MKLSKVKDIAGTTFEEFKFDIKQKCKINWIIISGDYIFAADGQHNKYYSGSIAMPVEPSKNLTFDIRDLVQAQGDPAAGFGFSPGNRMVYDLRDQEVFVEGNQGYYIGIYAAVTDVATYQVDLIFQNPIKI